MTPEYADSWRTFLATVEVNGAIPCRFSVVEDRICGYVLRSEMLVPDRDAAHPCQFCRRTYRDAWIVFQNALPAENDPTPREQIIRDRVVAMFTHEALESVHVAGHRAFDPHEARWYSNKVADWRYYR